MSKFFFFLAVFSHCFCFGQDSSRVVFIRMDEHRSRSDMHNLKGFTDHIMLNDYVIGTIEPSSVFIYDALSVRGTYSLTPGHKRVTIDPPAQSITFIELSIAETEPATAYAMLSEPAVFAMYYEKNKWLRKCLAAAGYNSIGELMHGYTPNSKEVPPGVRSSEVKKNSADTFFYYQSGEKASRKTANYYSTFHKERENYYGFRNYYSDNNGLKMEGYYSNIDSGIKDGPFTEYYRSGRVMSKGAYRKGEEHGAWEYFYDTLNNPVWYRCIYEDGYKQGELESFYESGKLKRREMHTMFRQESTKMATWKDSITKGKCYDETGQEIPFTPFEVMARIPYDMNYFLSQTLHYPEAARRKGKEGRVIIKVTIGGNGKVANAAVIKSVSPELDMEAIRVVFKMPSWIAGMRDDKPMNVVYTLPIVFRLE